MSLIVQHSPSNQAASTPVDLQAIRRRVNELVSAGEFRAATETLETALASAPDNQQLLIMLANDYARLRRNDDAIECFVRARAVGPDTPYILGKLGRMYIKVDKNSEAVPVLTEALQREPEEEAHLRLLTQAIRKSGSPEHAVEVFRTLHEKFPENDGIALALARFLELAKNYAGAVETLERVRSRSGTNRACLIQLGALHTKLRSPDKAIGLFEEALSQSPDDLDTTRQLALAWKAKGDLAKAASLLERVRDARPNSVAPLKDLGQVYAAAGDQARASEMDALAAEVAARIEKGRAQIGASTAFPGRWQLLDECLRLANPEGLVLEFGVATGTSLRYVAKTLGTDIYGFDSFEGLPEAWEGRAGQGAFLQPKLPEVPANAHLVVGWFNETLPGFLAEHQEKVRFLHIDCDLYISTKIVFDLLTDRFSKGTVILFDELWNYTGWENHEWRALCELADGTGLSYEFIGHVPKAGQVAIQITATGRDRQSPPVKGPARGPRRSAGRASKKRRR